MERKIEVVMMDGWCAVLCCGALYTLVHASVGGQIDE